ncbi:MAG: hypothetical protein IT168_22610 [Bryobacterales bacterium]|nr:hypothetical protein [Bryobacterales bacterium]
MGRGRFKKFKPLSVKPLVDLPVLDPALDEFVMYLAAQYNRSTIFLHNAAFGELVGAIGAANKVIPNSVSGITEMRGHVLIVCHQAFYSAASCIARGTPMDAASASRRTLEAARTALAVKLDARNVL